MTAKRFPDQSEQSEYWQNQRRQRARPSLASVIGEVVKMNFLQNFCTVLEPMLRRVVNEEVENGLRRRAPYSRSHSLRIKALEPSTMQLKFRKHLTLPIFTGMKILDEDGNPLEIYLVNISNNQESTISIALKLQIVVIDGDFPNAESNIWTKDEFEKNILKERRGKRPLLAGEVNITMRDGVACVGDVELTDNSSWIRSRKFRIAARVVHGANPGILIREAITEAFVVKDHRGELYKKHHPPRLEDDVWRLEKIGKDGAFHKKLAANGIKTVQDFLKLSVVDEPKLRKILGVGMSEKMWEVIINHARTCDHTGKLYISRGPNHTIFLNPICQIVKVVINGDTFSGNDITSVNQAYIRNFVAEAYQSWDSLEVVEGHMNDTPLLTQGDMVDKYHSNNQKSTEMYDGVQDHVSSVMASAYLYAPPVKAYNFSESSSQAEVADISHRFIN